MIFKLLTKVFVVLSLAQGIFAAVSWAGVNVAGFEFGCQKDASICDIRNNYPPLLSTKYGKDGPGQMVHFNKNHGFNIFRLPVTWQYLVNNKLGSDIDPQAMGKYDELMQACLRTGSHCILDIHNFARWDNKVIGQGGPANEQFAHLWAQLAWKYAKEDRVVMGLMNEPHNLDVEKWAHTLRHTIREIREAGARNQYILLPGNRWCIATELFKGSGPSLLNITNPDGSTENLIFEIHKYLHVNDPNYHGKSVQSCNTDGIDESFRPLAAWLRQHNRKALVAEIGGGSTEQSCMKYLCNSLAFLNQNSDVYMGYIGWSAGGFNSLYPYSLTPKGSSQEGFTDKPLLTQCFSKMFAGSPMASLQSPSATQENLTPYVMTIPPLKPYSNPAVPKPNDSKVEFPKGIDQNRDPAQPAHPGTSPKLPNSTPSNEISVTEKYYWWWSSFFNYLSRCTWEWCHPN